MPDGHGVQCYRVRIECPGGKVLRPIIAAASFAEAREKAAVLADEMCVKRLPWQRGGDPQETPKAIVVDARRIHRWWKE